jgi:hypothetical protein
MAKALEPNELALTGGTMDMSLPEEIDPVPTNFQGDPGFNMETGEVLPPVKFTPDERRARLLDDFQEGLAQIEFDLNEQLGGDPMKIDVDSQIFGWQEGAEEGLGQWGHKDEIYQRALGYVPLNPNALDAEEKAAVDEYAKQLKGQLLQEKQMKMALKQKYINQWVDMFKQALKDEQDRREIEETQANRAVAAKITAAKAEEDRKKNMQKYVLHNKETGETKTVWKPKGEDYTPPKQWASVKETGKLAKEKLDIQKSQTLASMRQSLTSSKGDKGLYEAYGPEYNLGNQRNEVVYWQSDPEGFWEGIKTKEQTKVISIPPKQRKKGLTPKKIQEMATEYGKTVEQVLKDLGIIA